VEEPLTTSSLLLLDWLMALLLCQQHWLPQQVQALEGRAWVAREGARLLVHPLMQGWPMVLVVELWKEMGVEVEVQVEAAHLNPCPRQLLPAQVL
jgi:hypothetical protein